MTQVNGKKKKRAVGKKANSTQQAIFSLTLNPWTEVIGMVAEVERDSIVLECNRLFRIHCTTGLIAKYRRLLRKGNVVGVLATDFGTKIRRVSKQDSSPRSTIFPAVE